MEIRWDEKQWRICGLDGGCKAAKQDESESVGGVNFLGEKREEYRNYEVIIDDVILVRVCRPKPWTWTPPKVNQKKKTGAV